MRAGPGTTYPVIGQAAAGQAFAITGRSPAGDWWGFVFEGGQGWISAGVVRANGAASGVAVAANIPPSPTPAPSATPQATPQPTAAARQASCPAWYQTPEPGKGFVVFENFQVARDQDAWPRFEQSGVEGQILVPARAADGTPGRTTFQWSPGKHTVKIQYFHGTIVMDVIVEAGKSYIVPMTEPHRVGWDQQPKTFPVYPLQPPAGCD